MKNKELELQKDKELEILREKVRQYESVNKPSSGKTYYDELQSIRNKGSVKTNSIEFKEVNDHKNIILYHTNGLRIGKMVGPIHPTNAEAAFSKFYELGIMLSSRKPTQEEIDLYKSGDEFKRLEAEFNSSLTNAPKSNSEIEKLTEAIAKMTGAPVVNSIKTPAEMAIR
jgi:hypothetical protein